MADTDSETRQAKTPPYVSYATFKGLIGELHEDGLPARIDRSILTRVSGTVGTQLMTALRFLGLITQDGRPTTDLAHLEASYGTDEWPLALASVLRNAYAPILALDLTTATPSQFTETFAEAFPGADAVRQKSIAFFLPAAKDAGIPIGQRILSGKKPRQNGSVRRRTAKPAGDAKPVAPKSEHQHQPPPPPFNGAHSTPTAPTSFQLVALLDPNVMSQEEQQAVLLLVQYLRRKEAAGSYGEQ